MKLQLPFLVKKVLATIEKVGFEAYVVGGSVRDVLTEKRVNDWDFTTNATPEKIQEIFPESFYDNSFGTVGITVEELIEQFELNDYSYDKEDLKLSDVFEITTFRTEGRYSDNRRPDMVNWGKTIDEDLKRRDFTINAMALRLGDLNSIVSDDDLKKDNELIIIDLYDGRKDLELKLIRAVGNPDERFQEDALRMIRAVRMASQHGLLIEPKTLEAIINNSHLLSNISWERIRDELMKILISQYCADGMKLLLSSGLLKYILPELVNTVGIEQGGHHTKDVWHHSIDALEGCPSKDPIVRLATLLHDIGKPVAYRKNNGKITFYGHEVVGGRIVKKIGIRLHLSNKDQERLYILVRHHMFTYDSEMTDAAIRRFIRKVELKNINDMIMLRIGDRVGGGSKQTSWRLREFQQRIGKVLYTPMQVKDLKVSGNDVMEILNVKGGPIVGEILGKLFEEVLEDSEKNDREYLVKRMKELVNT